MYTRQVKAIEYLVEMGCEDLWVSAALKEFVPQADRYFIQMWVEISDNYFPIIALTQDETGNYSVVKEDGSLHHYSLGELRFQGTL